MLCAMDSDGDDYTDIDMSVFHYCQLDSHNQLCRQVRDKWLNFLDSDLLVPMQDICPYLYNPLQSPDKLDGGSLNSGELPLVSLSMRILPFSAVAFVVDGVVLPSGLIIANVSLLASKSVKCLTTEESSEIAITFYNSDSSTVSVDHVCYISGCM